MKSVWLLPEVFACWNEKKIKKRDDNVDFMKIFSGSHQWWFLLSLLISTLNFREISSKWSSSLEVQMENFRSDATFKILNSYKKTKSWQCVGEIPYWDHSSATLTSKKRLLLKDESILQLKSEIEIEHVSKNQHFNGGVITFTSPFFFKKLLRTSILLHCFSKTKFQFKCCWWSSFLRSKREWSRFKK